MYLSWGYEELYDEYYGQVASIHYKEEEDGGAPGQESGGGTGEGTRPGTSNAAPGAGTGAPGAGGMDAEVTTNTTWPHGYGVKFYADGSIYVGKSGHHWL